MKMEGPYPGSTYDPKKCPFWPATFRANGYQTAQIGKWHTGTDTGFGRDWDFQMVWNRPRHTKNAGSYYGSQLIEKNGGPAEKRPGYSTDNYTQWAVDYLKGSGRVEGQPWYLWLCYGAVHGPFTPADRHLNAYEDVSIPVPADIFPPRPGKPDYLQQIKSWYSDNGVPRLAGRPNTDGRMRPRRGIHGSDLNSWVRQYHQGVKALDEAVGRLVETLKKTGQFENTLIVFTSDQGYAWGQHGLRSKVAPYDAAVRCPLIFSMPSRLPQGEVVNAPAGGVDLVPTFFDFAGISLPWPMHGNSLRPMLQDSTAKRPKPLLTVHTGRRYGSDTDRIPVKMSELARVAGVPWYAALHDGRYKYVRTFVENEIEELYDLCNDPDELSNLALQPIHGERIKQMRRETVRQLRESDAGFVDALPAVRHPVGG